MENKMRVVLGIVAAAFLVPLAANAETIDGLFGIKFVTTGSDLIATDIMRGLNT